MQAASEPKGTIFYIIIDQFNINASVNQTLHKLSVWFVKCQKTTEKYVLSYIEEYKSKHLCYIFALMVNFITRQKHAEHHVAADASPVSFLNLKSSV